MTYSASGLLAAIQADAGSGQEVHDPATGELIGYAPVDTVEDLNKAVEAARAAQPAFEALGHAERSKLLHAAADAVDENAEALAYILSREQGKPLDGPNARFEVGACSAWLRAAADTPLETETILDDETGRATLTYRALGVVGAIGPWNWPMMITVWQIAGSLRMGNTVVVKPSEYTPLSVLALIHVLNTALPENVLQVVAGGRDVGAAMSTNEGFDKIMFLAPPRPARRSLIVRLNPRPNHELGNGADVLDDVVERHRRTVLSLHQYRPDVCGDERLYSIRFRRGRRRSSTSQRPCRWALASGAATSLTPYKTRRSSTSLTAGQVDRRGREYDRGWKPDYDARSYFYPTTIVTDISRITTSWWRNGSVRRCRSFVTTTSKRLLPRRTNDVGLGSSFGPDRDRA